MAGLVTGSRVYPTSGIQKRTTRDALVVSADPFFLSHRDRLVKLTARHAMPAIYYGREFAVTGGLKNLRVQFWCGEWKGAWWVEPRRNFRPISTCGFSITTRRDRIKDVGAKLVEHGLVETLADAGQSIWRTLSGIAPSALIFIKANSSSIRFIRYVSGRRSRSWVIRF